MPDKPLPVVVLEWKPLRRNTLRGFARIQLGSLRMNEITVHVSNGRKWAGLPARPVLGADGAAQRDDRGKMTYAPLLEWENRAMADRFSAAVVAAIEDQYPGATDKGN